ncbi:DUF4430 domain-containing protein [Patescibacteria group bacterium]
MKKVFNNTIMENTFSRLFRAAAVAAVCGMMLVWGGGAADAATYSEVTVRIETGESTFFNETVYLSDEGCVVQDSVGGEHTLAGANALCALDLAAQQGGFTYELVYYDGFGLLLNSVADYAGDSSNYWLYYVNYESASVGMSDYELADGDEMILSYGGFEPPLRLTLNRTHAKEGARIVATVDYSSSDWLTGARLYLPVEGAEVHFGNTVLATDVNGEAVFYPAAMGTYSVYAESDSYTRSEVFNYYIYILLKKYYSFSRYGRAQYSGNGVDYLIDQMDDDGLVNGSQSMTEWAAMALVTAGEKNKKMFQAVKRYRPTSKDGTSEIARHILALEAIGKNSRKYGGANYVKRLKKTYSNGQFGSEYYCNDDIFAVLALRAADVPYSSKYIRNSVEFTYDCIDSSGGVSFAVGGTPDIDTTAAWLGMASRLKGKKKQHGLSLKPMRLDAADYLRDAQNPDGGWGYTAGAVSNSSSTAWVLQALRARGHEAKSMTTNNLNGYHFLGSTARKKSGAFRYDLHQSSSMEALNTAYAVISLNGKAFPVNKKAALKR